MWLKDEVKTDTREVFKRRILLNTLILLAFMTLMLLWLKVLNRSPRRSQSILIHIRSIKGICTGGQGECIVEEIEKECSMFVYSKLF